MYFLKSRVLHLILVFSFLLACEGSSDRGGGRNPKKNIIRNNRGFEAVSTCGENFPPTNFKTVDLPGVFPVDFIDERYFGAENLDRSAIAIHDTQTTCNFVVLAGQEIEVTAPKQYLVDVDGEADLEMEIGRLRSKFYDRCEQGEIQSSVSIEKVNSAADFEIASICEIEAERSTLQLNLRAGQEEANLLVFDGSLFLWE